MGSVSADMWCARSYICYLVFQLKTHTELFKGEDDDAQPMLTLGTSIGLLTAITAVVAVCSEFLTDTIQEVSEQTHMSQAFIGARVDRAGQGRATQGTGGASATEVQQAGALAALGA